MAAELLPSGAWVVSPNRGEAAAFAGADEQIDRLAAIEVGDLRANR